MKTAGALLIVIGVVGAFLSAFAIDTSVATGSYGDLSSLLPSRVTNLGLQQAQLLAFIASATLSIIGTTLLAVGTAIDKLQQPGLPPEDVTVAEEQEPTDQRPVLIALLGVMAAVVIGFVAAEVTKPAANLNQADENMAYENAVDMMNRTSNATNEVRRARR